MNATEIVMARLARGLHTALLGPEPLELSSKPAMFAVTVNCARTQQPLAPLYEARAQVAALMQATPAPSFEPDDRHALHRRLLEDEDDRHNSDFVAVANRLQRRLDRRLLIVFEHIDRADNATVALLSRIVDEGSLLATLLFCADTRDPGRAGRLIATLEQVEGAEAIVVAGDEASDNRAAARAELTSSELPALDVLHFDVRRVLRAGAVAGDTFEADVVGELLGLDSLSALEIVQAAIDQDVPIEDLGEGVFRLPPEAAKQLRASVTPSLMAAWHQMLAMMLGDEQPAPEMTAEPPPETKPQPAKRPVAAPTRAAAHAEAAGDVDRATRRYVAAAQEAASVGGYEHAVELLERALRLLEHAPETAERRELRMTALMDIGRLKWVAAGRTPGFDFDAALAALEGARELMQPSDPPELRAEIGALMARVSYEIGGSAQLERALALLGDARRTLLHAGRRIEAARLLNDEAAVRVRLGQLGHAAQLLQDSRDVFAQLARTDAVARRELADTEHLTARLLLHTPEEHRDQEALALAVESARSAEHRYDELGDVRSRARAWETMARLELMRGRADEALEHLTSAVRVQEHTGDAVGLARTLAAMSDVMAASGAPSKALALLTDSVAMNQRKGSRQGLRYNREALDSLMAKLSADDRRQLEAPISALRARLDDAR